MRFTSVASARSEARALRVQPGPGYPSGSPGPLSQIETSATSFGMVGERAKVLGRLGGACPPLIQERVLYPAHRSSFTGRGL